MKTSIILSLLTALASTAVIPRAGDAEGDDFTLEVDGVTYDLAVVNQVAGDAKYDSNDSLTVWSDLLAAIQACYGSCPQSLNGNFVKDDGSTVITEASISAGRAFENVPITTWNQLVVAMNSITLQEGFPPLMDVLVHDQTNDQDLNLFTIEWVDTE